MFLDFYSVITMSKQHESLLLLINPLIRNLLHCEENRGDNDFSTIDQNVFGAAEGDTTYHLEVMVKKTRGMTR